MKQEEDETSEGWYKKMNVSISRQDLRLQIIPTTFLFVNDTDGNNFEVAFLSTVLSEPAGIGPPFDGQHAALFTYPCAFACVNCMFKNSLTVDYYLCSTAPPLELI